MDEAKIKMICRSMDIDVDKVPSDVLLGLYLEDDIAKCMQTLAGLGSEPKKITVIGDRGNGFNQIENSSQVNTLQSDMRYLRNDLEGLHTSIGDKLRRLTTRAADLALLLKKEPVDVLGQVEAYVRNSSFYSGTIHVERNKIRVQTGEVVIHDFRPDHEVDRKFSLGEFEVVFSMTSPEIYVQPIGNNVNVEDYYHPHVSSSYRVCWGNAHSALTEWAETYNPQPALRALELLLVTYNADSPYRSLDNFIAKKIPKELIQAQIDAGNVEYEDSDNYIEYIGEHVNHSPDDEDCINEDSDDSDDWVYKTPNYTRVVNVEYLGQQVEVRDDNYVFLGAGKYMHADKAFSSWSNY